MDYLYCQSFTELIPYFFANNNVNYAEWLPIHLRDMLTLKEKHPKVAEEFEMARFVIHKSCHEFSGMAIDQAHEQANAVIKAEQLVSQKIPQHCEDGWLPDLYSCTL